MNDFFKIYCGNGVIVNKKAIKEVGHIKNVQTKLQALANLFWPGKVYEWALTEGTAPNVIEDVHIEAMTSKFTILPNCILVAHSFSEGD